MRKKRCLVKRKLTNYESNFTVWVIIATSHHGSYGVIDHCQNINVDVLIA